MPSRLENELQTILGEETELETPKSRVEKIYMNMIDPEYQDLEPPKSRVESLLYKIAEQGGGEKK